MGIRDLNRIANIRVKVNEVYYKDYGYYLQSLASKKDNDAIEWMLEGLKNDVERLLRVFKKSRAGNCDYPKLKDA